MDIHYNNNSVIFNRVHNLVIVKTDQQTLTKISTDVFWTKIFEEATGRAIKKPLGRNQGNPQTADNTAVIYNIILCIKRAGSILDKTPPLFYPFSSEAEYAQVSWWVSHGTSNRAINKWFNNIRLQGIFANHFSY